MCWCIAAHLLLKDVEPFGYMEDPALLVECSYRFSPGVLAARCPYGLITDVEVHRPHHTLNQISALVDFSNDSVSLMMPIGFDSPACPFGWIHPSTMILQNVAALILPKSCNNHPRFITKIMTGGSRVNGDHYAGQGWD